MTGVSKVILWIIALPLLLYAASWVMFFCAQFERDKVYEFANVTGQEKSFFVDAFFPGVTTNHVTHLSYARTGGREPPYIAIATFTDEGLEALREGTEDITGGESPQTYTLGEAVDWWDYETNIITEVRHIYWKGDHMATFFIPTNNPAVYITAVIH